MRGGREKILRIAKILAEKREPIAVQGTEKVLNYTRDYRVENSEVDRI